MDKKNLILPVKKSKNGQKRVTIPKESEIDDGDYILVTKVIL